MVTRAFSLHSTTDALALTIFRISFKAQQKLHQR
jgi:hypothetical protein